VDVGLVGFFRNTDFLSDDGDILVYTLLLDERRCAPFFGVYGACCLEYLLLRF
jgi:hypothetical protein